MWRPIAISVILRTWPRRSGLRAGARILDVACGSGWLSEYFARLGYDVTGIDISPTLIQIAEERVRAVPGLVDHQTEIRCRFRAHDIEISPLEEKFDAIICYDAMHHFVDEHAVVRHFAAMLPMGGLLFILEGNRPPAASAAEAELVAVMQKVSDPRVSLRSRLSRSIAGSIRVRRRGRLRQRQ